MHATLGYRFTGMSRVSCTLADKACGLCVSVLLSHSVGLPELTQPKSHRSLGRRLSCPTSMLSRNLRSCAGVFSDLLRSLCSSLLGCGGFGDPVSPDFGDDAAKTRFDLIRGSSRVNSVGDLPSDADLPESAGSFVNHGRLLFLR